MTLRKQKMETNEILKILIFIQTKDKFDENSALLNTGSSTYDVTVKIDFFDITIF
jgi:hypothetical protein